MIIISLLIFLDSSNVDIQISFLFATSDLVDVDDSGIDNRNIFSLLFRESLLIYPCFCDLLSLFLPLTM